LLSFPAAAPAYPAEGLFGANLVPEMRWSEHQLVVWRENEFGQAQLNGHISEAVI